MPKNAETLLTDFLQCALKRLAEIFNGFDTQYLEPSRLIMRDSLAIVEVHTRCQHHASGVWLDTRKQHVWLLEDGWPVKLQEFYDLEQFETFMNCTRR
jgi:hypothetical protein